MSSSTSSSHVSKVAASAGFLLDAEGGKAGIKAKTKLKVGGQLEYEYERGKDKSHEVSYMRKVETMDLMGIDGNWEETICYPDLGRRFVPENNMYLLIDSRTAQVTLLINERTGTVLGTDIEVDHEQKRRPRTLMVPINPKFLKAGVLDGLVGGHADPDYLDAYNRPRSYMNIPLKQQLMEESEVQRKAAQAYLLSLEREDNQEDFKLKRMKEIEGMIEHNLHCYTVWNSGNALHTEKESYCYSVADSYRISRRHHFQVGGHVEAEASVVFGGYGLLDLMYTYTKFKVHSKASQMGKGAYLNVDLDPEGYLPRVKMEGGARPTIEAKPCPGKVSSYGVDSFRVTPSLENFDRLRERISDLWLHGPTPEAAIVREALEIPKEIFWVTHVVDYVQRVSNDQFRRVMVTQEIRALPFGNEEGNQLLLVEVQTRLAGKKSKDEKTLREVVTGILTELNQHQAPQDSLVDDVFSYVERHARYHEWII
ncbi:MAG: hypothetical protein KDK65_03125 [Chlamydiia bacterium]|nr:hypothetical protein [Chlamydiia bacterium]